MKTLSVTPIKTSIYRQENLADFIVKSIPQDLIKEEMILAITSKIVSLAENRLVPQNQISKENLVKQEADIFFGEIGYGCFLTVKDGLLIPSAGIDESNSETGSYILYPENPAQSAQELWKALKEKWQLQKLGIILTDSHTTPLRRGVTGISLSSWGFKPIRKLVGTKDLFGRELKMTNMNLVDGIATAAVMMMGEGCESTPLAVVTGVEVEFNDLSNLESLSIPLSDDLYGPLLRTYLETHGQHRN